MEIESAGIHRHIVNLRAFALTAALFGSTYLLWGCPAGYATTAPAHDGGIDDIDAIGNRNVGCAKGADTGIAWKNRSHWANRFPNRWSCNPR